jgi:hypothetical protein
MRSPVWLVVFMVALAQCGGAASTPDPTPESTPPIAAAAATPPRAASVSLPPASARIDVSGRTAVDYRVETGVFAVRIDPHFAPLASTCTTWWFAALLVFAQGTRPPVTLRLVHEGVVVDSHTTQRCFEANSVDPPFASCTLVVQHGGAAWDNDVRAERYDLLVDNRNQPLDAKLELFAQCVPRD